MRRTALREMLTTKTVFPLMVFSFLFFFAFSFRRLVASEKRPLPAVKIPNILNTR